MSHVLSSNMFKRLNVRSLKRAFTALEIKLATGAVNTRPFLSHAYQCREVWDRRLESTVFKNINLDKLYHEIDQNYQQTKHISPVDVDIFANAVTDETKLGELQDLVHKLRLSAESSNALKSTGHAVIRAFVAHGRAERLLDILDDRINYGVFLDHYDANLMMDMFLKNEDRVGAAKVAVQLMLQEDFSHDLTRALAALSCYSYLKNPTDWPVETAAVQEPHEEVKVRVKFLRNPYFDDHFDSRDPKRLVGKTLAAIGSVGSGPLDRSLRVIGLALSAEEDRVLDTIKRFDGGSIYSETKTFVENRAVLDALERLKPERGSIEDELAKNVEKAVAECAERDVAERCDLYGEWEADRRRAIDEQIARLEKAESLKNIAKMEVDLKNREQHLRFFENEEQLDLQIDDKKVFYRKRWFGKKKTPRKVDVDYVPPEIGSRRE